MSESPFSYKQIKAYIQIFILKPLLYILFGLLQLSVKIFMKQKRELVLFFIIERYFFDNSKALSEHLIKEGRKEVVFLAKEKSVQDELKELGYSVCSPLSLKGLYLYLKSYLVVISYGTSFIDFFPYFLSSRLKKVLYLGHGIPMKSIGRAVPRYQRYFNKHLLQGYTYATVSSYSEGVNLSSAFNVDLRNIAVTNMPRNDYLYNDKLWDRTLLTRFPLLREKVILYAPTWRGGGESTQLFPFADFTEQDLLDFLKRESIHIIFRLHPEDERHAVASWSGLESSGYCHFMGQSVVPDVVTILPFIDLLVSDYSGMIFDFLPLNRPMLFIPYDIDEYRDRQGVRADFSEVTPGESISTFSQFKISASSSLKGDDPFRERRADVNRVIYETRDGDSCNLISRKFTL